MSQVEYLLGHGDREVRRLELQAGIFAPGTERIVRAAGLAPGMSVLDIGTGAGDVAMLAARIVGASGSVLGIDREASVLERARARAMEAGLAAVLRFEHGDLEGQASGPSFDMAVGRYVLLYQPDRAAFLRRAAACLRPGGVLVFVEPGFAEPDTLDGGGEEPRSRPAVPLYEEAWRILYRAFKLSGARGRTGAELVSLFHAAGLPEPTILQEVPTGGPGSPIVEWICLTVQSVLPLLARHGVETIAGAEAESFHARMGEEVLASRSQLRGAELIGGWARLP